jgi:16S rRNA (guanine1516-N2)-methyltransferase
MLPRVKPGMPAHEMLVKTAKIKNAEGPLTAVDATAGLGEDSILLAAAGFHVTMFEKNPVIHALLTDALDRAKAIPELAEIVGRMALRHADSIEGMKNLDFTPDVILLDPMFPARQKSALVKKKLQMIQKLEFPCIDEGDMILSAMGAGPKKLIIKRPPKGPYLAGIKPDHSIEGKAVRFDCIVNPLDRIEKYKALLL